MPGEIIIRENEPGDVFYLIRSGEAVVIKGAINTPTILGFRSPGDAIGEMALLENRPRSASVIALTPMSLWSLGREMFYSFLSENPEFSMNLMNMLSWRVRQSDEERLRGYVREKYQMEALEELSEKAVRDPLTGLYNRRHMDFVLRDQVIHALQFDSTVGVLMADVDYFKQINDIHGHKAGDLVLQAIGKLLKKCVRSVDSLCRYGGEEFVIIMPGASILVLRRCAEEIRARFEALRVEYDGKEIYTTISIGIASFPQHGSDGEEVLYRADHALYKAKNGGRNRVVVYSPESEAAV